MCAETSAAERSARSRHWQRLFDVCSATARASANACSVGARCRRSGVAPSRAFGCGPCCTDGRISALRCPCVLGRQHQRPGGSRPGLPARSIAPLSRLAPPGHGLPASWAALTISAWTEAIRRVAPPRPQPLRRGGPTANRRARESGPPAAESSSPRAIAIARQRRPHDAWTTCTPRLHGPLSRARRSRRAAFQVGLNGGRMAPLVRPLPSRRAFSLLELAMHARPADVARPGRTPLSSGRPRR